MNKPTAILISDVHYSLNNLELSDKAFRTAIDKASELNIPLVDCGDITNDKAILRAEVVNRLIDTMLYAKSKNVVVYLLVGNHSLCNEKGKEHSLNFLRPYAKVIDSNTFVSSLNLWLLPYNHDSEHLVKVINNLIPKKSTLIMHQGFKGAWMGDYVQDKTSIDPEAVKDFTVISGHYHRHQTIGTVTYIGSPFTMSFGEANDGPKGFLILNDDGTFNREILRLRKHTVYDWDLTQPGEPTKKHGENDLVWIKIKGPQSQLINYDKTVLGDRFVGYNNFKLDITYTDDKRVSKKSKTMTNPDLLDTLIDATGDTVEFKDYMKQLWKDL